MAGAIRNWRELLAIAALLVGAVTVVSAQSSGTGSLAGKLTDLHSKPLEGATVTVRNQATGAEASTVTAKNGAYRFSGLAAGEYTLQAESPRLGRGQVEGILIDAGQESRVQTAIELRISAAKPLQIATHRIEPLVPLLIAALPAEPIPALGLPGRKIPVPARVIPLLVAPPLDAVLTSAPYEPLSLPGRSLPVAATQQPLAAAGARQPQAVAGAGTAQPALQLPAPQAKPIDRNQEALEAGGPTAQAVTTTVTGDQLQSLPLSGRHWQNFVLDTPMSPAGGESQGSERSFGQQQNAMSVDGAGMGLAFGGQGGSGETAMVRAWSGGHGFPLSGAAIREVQTVSGNVEAEGARAAGGRINVETMRGGNGLHGQGFLYDRVNAWGAQNPFTQWVTETSEVAPLAPFSPVLFPVFDNGLNGPPEPYTPPDHGMTWGIGLGSRIRRDKLFWFAALDSYQRNDPGLAMVKHPYLVQTLSGCDVVPCPASPNPIGFFAQPSDDQMQVLCKRLEPTNQQEPTDPSSCDNPVAEGLAQYSSELENLASLLGPTQRSAMQWTGFGRIDWEAAERHRITVEGTGATSNSPGGGLTSTSENYGNHSFGSSQASEQWLLGRWEAFLTPNLLAVTQASAGRTILEARPETPSDFEKPFLGPNVWGQLPEIVVDNRYGFTIGNPSRFGQGSYPDERLYQVQQAVDWVHGPLLVKAGFSVGHNSDVISLLRNKTGTFTYSNVENFISDALAFGTFGISNPTGSQHGCDQTGTVWRDSGGGLRGQGGLPCYSYYSQTIGPTGWHLSTNDWAGYVTSQWQIGKRLTLAAGLRWEREQLPPPITGLDNPDLPLTQKLPDLGNQWAPRFSLAWGNHEHHWPVLRMGYGMFFGRTENATLETVLTQTGSPNGDMSFFIRPTDGLNTFTGTSGAPPFPYVLSGPPLSVVKPGAVEFAPSFRNPEIHQAVVDVEQTLPAHVQIAASAMVSLGRRLPISIDTNFDPTFNPGTITYAVEDASGLGPIKAKLITVPFYASWPSNAGSSLNCPNDSPAKFIGLYGRCNPNYQQIAEITDRANSTYEAAMLKVSRYGRRGLSLHAHYTYSHAMDWNPNESTQVAGSDVLDPANFGLEYGTSNMDVRHSAAATVVWETPWKLHHLAGKLANGWMVSGIGRFRSGMPYTMRTSGSLATEFDNGAGIVGLATGMNGSGGDNRVYGVGEDGRTYNIGRNTYRYPDVWKADMRLGKSFDLGAARHLELLAESFNLLNHQNVTEIETTGYYLQSGSTTSFPTLNFLTGAKAGTTAFGQPLNINATNFYSERQFELGMRMRF